MNATLTVTDDASTGGGIQSVALSGIGALPTATLSGSLLPFTGGSVAGTPQTLTLTNTSNVPLTITGIYFNPSGAWSQANTCGLAGGPSGYPLVSPTLLAAGASCDITITFSSFSTAIQTATIGVTDNAISGGGTQNASLSGSGNASLATLSPLGRLSGSRAGRLS